MNKYSVILHSCLILTLLCIISPLSAEGITTKKMDNNIFSNPVLEAANSKTLAAAVTTPTIVKKNADTSSLQLITYKGEDFTMKVPDGWEFTKVIVDTGKSYFFSSPDNLKRVYVYIGKGSDVNSASCDDAVKDTKDVLSSDFVSISQKTLTLDGTQACDFTYSYSTSNDNGIPLSAIARDVDAVINGNYIRVEFTKYYPAGEISNNLDIPESSQNEIINSFHYTKGNTASSQVTKVTTAPVVIKTTQPIGVKITPSSSTLKLVQESGPDFTIKAPEGWKKKDLSENGVTSVHFTSPEGKKLIVISLKDDLFGSLSNDYLSCDTQIKEREKLDENFVLISQKSSSLDDGEACDLTYSYLDTQEKTSIKTVVQRVLKTDIEGHIVGVVIRKPVSAGDNSKSLDIPESIQNEIINSYHYTGGTTTPSQVTKVTTAPVVVKTTKLVVTKNTPYSSILKLVTYNGDNFAIKVPEGWNVKENDDGMGVSYTFKPKSDGYLKVYISKNPVYDEVTCDIQVQTLKNSLKQFNPEIVSQKSTIIDGGTGCEINYKYSITIGDYTSDYNAKEVAAKINGYYVLIDMWNAHLASEGTVNPVLSEQIQNEIINSFHYSIH